MARHSHSRPRTRTVKTLRTARAAARRFAHKVERRYPRTVKTLRKVYVPARRFEQTMERHWPFAAYGAFTIAVGVYVIAQLAPLA